MTNDKIDLRIVKEMKAKWNQSKESTTDPNVSVEVNKDYAILRQERSPNKPLRFEEVIRCGPHEIQFFRSTSKTFEMLQVKMLQEGVAVGRLKNRPIDDVTAELQQSDYFIVNELVFDRGLITEYAQEEVDDEFERAIQRTASQYLNV
jgi:hypothetical protein